MTNSSVEKAKIKVEEQIREIYESRPASEFNQELIDAKKDVRMKSAKAQDIKEILNYVSSKCEDRERDYEDKYVAGYVQCFIGIMGGFVAPFVVDSVAPNINCGIGEYFLGGLLGTAGGIANYYAYLKKPISNLVNDLSEYILQTKLDKVHGEQIVARHKVEVLQNPEKYFKDDEECEMDK